jgi:predicted MPP superfamily phosphohydrolase
MAAVPRTFASALKKVSHGLIYSLLAGVIALASWGLLVEPGMLMRRHVSREGWPGTELKVAFFSDLHAGAPHIDQDYIEKLIARIAAESPDLVLIGGDLVINGIIGGRPIPVADVATLLSKLKPPLGVFAVLGNHDWWFGGNEVASALEKNGIRVIGNDAVLIDRHDGSKFWLLGIGDDFTGHADAGRAFLFTDNSRPKIVFMHDPGALFQIKDRFNIAFAGHLHGGQIYLPGYGAIVTPGRAPRSWAQHEWIDFELGSLFVSSGIGTSILPVRVNAPPEFVIARLTPHQSSF